MKILTIKDASPKGEAHLRTLENEDGQYELAVSDGKTTFDIYFDDRKDYYSLAKCIEGVIMENAIVEIKMTRIATPIQSQTKSLRDLLESAAGEIGGECDKDCPAYASDATYEKQAAECTCGYKKVRYGIELLKEAHA